MTIQIDSREKPKAIQKVLKSFDDAGIDYFVSKLYAGDYMNMDNPRLVVDRKQNLTEICSNVTQDHERFRRELLRCQEHDIHIVVLIEHGDGIEELEDVLFWENPRRHKRSKVNGKWADVETKATSGETLYKILQTLSRKYGVEFQFCSKDETGERIIEILGGEWDGDNERGPEAPNPYEGCG